MIKIESFNLKAALNGEPVMLRDGRKAFIRHHEIEQPMRRHWELWGVTINEDGFVMLTSWSKDGSYSIDGCDSGLDIIGMYEAKATHKVNGFEVPAPETEKLKEGNSYFYPDIFSGDFYGEDRWSNDNYSDNLSLKRGLVFLSKEDAIANAKAMLGIDPYGESED